MPNFKDANNAVHFLDDEKFIDLLPPGCIPISDEEAEYILTPPSAFYQWTGQEWVVSDELRRASLSAEIEALERSTEMLRAMRALLLYIAETFIQRTGDTLTPHQPYMDLLALDDHVTYLKNALDRQGPLIESPILGQPT